MPEGSNYTPLLGAGVYLLLHNGEVVYVGQSVNLLKRLYTHQNTQWIAFDAVRVVACARHDLSRIEAQLIEQYQPKGNVRKLLGWPEKRIDLAALGLKRCTMRRRRV